MAQGRITNERRNKFVSRRNTSTVFGPFAKHDGDIEGCRSMLIASLILLLCGTLITIQ